MTVSLRQVETVEDRTLIPDADITATLGLDRRATRGTRLRKWLLWSGLAIAAAGIAFATVWMRSQRSAVEYRTEEARRGSLTVTVEATGSLEPLTQVNVGTEISGIIQTVRVDINDQVRVGQILAEVNTDKLTAQAGQARATLDSARAKALETEATVDETERAAVRARELAKQRLLPQSDLDAAEATSSRAQATLASARAQVVQAEATLNAIESDRRKATIRSPIAGVVLDRQVDPGQTVAASFQTPVLFVLAQDLSQMRLSVDVDEADVGRVRIGQEAAFTVDAYPDRAFVSRVVDVRSMAETVNGVVTYEALLDVDNAEFLLRPGMTATAAITVTHLPDALLVPNAALRFTPPEESEEGSSTSGGGRGLIGALLPRPPRASTTRPGDTATRGRQRVWTLQNGQPMPIEVAVGVTGGTLTEVVSGDLAPGTAVLVDVITTE